MKRSIQNKIKQKLRQSVPLDVMAMFAKAKKK